MALIIFDSKTSIDNALNVIDPADSSTDPTLAAAGVPWQYTIGYGSGNASGVYIGNGYLLTALHVTDADASAPLLINGTTYHRDTSFGSIPLTLPAEHGGHAVDLKVQRIVGDPALSPLPLLPSTIEDRSRPVVACGWGEGKGSVVTNLGWNWGNGTRALRWGTNTTYASGIISYSIGSVVTYDAIATLFNSSVGASECQATLGDSGSGLFLKSGATWFLAGITTTVTQNWLAYYDSDLTYFVRLKDYAWLLRFDHWKAYYNLAAELSDSDSDGDGIPLLLEYAFGLDPTSHSSHQLPATSFENDSLVLTYHRLASTTDLQWIFETSDSLAADSWTPVSPAITVTDNASVFQTHKATIPLDGATQKFARIRIVKLP